MRKNREGVRLSTTVMVYKAFGEKNEIKILESF